jgi:hypothetical protein
MASFVGTLTNTISELTAQLQERDDKIEILQKQINDMNDYIAQYKVHDDSLKIANEKIKTLQAQLIELANSLDTEVQGKRIVKCEEPEVTSSVGPVMELTGDLQGKSIAKRGNPDVTYLGAKTLRERFFERVEKLGINSSMVSELLNVADVYAFGALVTEALYDESWNICGLQLVALKGKCSTIGTILRNYGCSLLHTHDIGEIDSRPLWSCDKYPNVRLYYPTHWCKTFKDSNFLPDFKFLANYYDGNWFTIVNRRAVCKKVHETEKTKVSLGIYARHGFKVSNGVYEPDTTLMLDDRSKITYK